MIQHSEIADTELRKKIKRSKIRFGGNRKLKIFGTLSCTAGKKMKRENRVFFATEKEAVENQYRPCGRCMKAHYLKWKHGLI